MEPWSVPFVEHPVHSFLSAKGEQEWTVSAIYCKYQWNLSVRLSQGNCFKLCYERSNDWICLEKPENRDLGP